MKLITESYLRKEYIQQDFNKILKISKGCKFTPSATDFINARHIVVQEETEDNIIQNGIEYAKPKNKNDWETPTQYKILYTGEMVSEKPESMTHLYENVLVYKDEARIILRGKLDIFQAKIIETQVDCTQHFQRLDLIPILEELLQFSRSILGYEVLNQPLPETTLLGMTMEELRDKSHHPEHYFGLKQMVLIQHSFGVVVARLNRLRAEAREIELVAVSTFRKGDYYEREDLVRALNRLSSAFHILMYQELERRDHEH